MIGIICSTAVPHDKDPDPAFPVKRIGIDIGLDLDTETDTKKRTNLERSND